MKLIESNEKLPNLTKMIQQKDRLKSAEHAILIFLILTDFYLILLG